MNSFEYYAPTRVVFGKDTVDQVAALVSSFGGKNICLVYGGGSVVRSGLLNRVQKNLEESNFNVLLLGGVVPNPQVGLVEEGIRLCKEHKTDFLLAVGGGSVIDTAKAIAVGLCDDDNEIWDYYLKGLPIQKALPVGVVLTLAAAGSEMSNASVITNERTGLKKGIGSDLLRPRFAIMDPTLTYTLPPYQTSAGIVDIMMHTLERYFGASRGNEMSDRIAEGLLKNVIYWGPKCLENPEDYQARSEIMWAGSLSHNGLTGLGNSGGWTCHPIEHELSGMFNVTHGAGLAVVWCQWSRKVMQRDLNRFIQYAVNVWDCPIDPIDPSKTAMEGILRTEDFFKRIGMPVNNEELGVGTLSEEQAEKMARICTENGSVKLGPVVPMDLQDVIEIYLDANK